MVKISNLFFAVVLIFLIYLLWVMMQPFIGAVIFASIVAGSVYPLYLKLVQRTGFKRSTTAVLVCILIVFIVFLPMIWLFIELSREAVNLYQNLTSVINNESVSNFLFGEGYFARFVRHTTSLLNLDISLEELRTEIIGYIKSLSVFALSTINQVLANILKFLLNFAVMILVIYAFLSEGAELKEFLMKLSPLPADQEELIIKKFNQMNFVTLVGNGVGGLIQGVLAGVGFWAADIDSVVLWTTVMTILAFIPLLGISMVYIPVCVYLLLTGEYYSGGLLFFYCSAIAFITENWFKPLFIGNRIQINSLLVLLCIIGGMSVFGLVGIFFGPLIAILFLTTVELYHKYYSAD